jgi:hypothetical protein
VRRFESAKSLKCIRSDPMTSERWFAEHSKTQTALRGMSSGDAEVKMEMGPRWRREAQQKDELLRVHKEHVAQIADLDQRLNQELVARAASEAHAIMLEEILAEERAAMAKQESAYAQLHCNYTRLKESMLAITQHDQVRQGEFEKRTELLNTSLESQEEFRRQLVDVRDTCGELSARLEEKEAALEELTTAHRALVEERDHLERENEVVTLASARKTKQCAELVRDKYKVYQEMTELRSLKGISKSMMKRNMVGNMAFGSPRPANESDARRLMMSPPPASSCSSSSSSSSSSPSLHTPVRSGVQTPSPARKTASRGRKSPAWVNDTETDKDYDVFTLEGRLRKQIKAQLLSIADLQAHNDMLSKDQGNLHTRLKNAKHSVSVLKKQNAKFNEQQEECTCPSRRTSQKLTLRTFR